MRVSRTIPIASAKPSAKERRTHTRDVVEVEAIQALASGEYVVESGQFDGFAASVLDRVPRERREKRRGTHVHVSDLLGKCVRKIAICDRESIPVAPDRLSLSEKLTYAQGDAIHDVIKDISTLTDPAQVWGKWKCECGHLYHEEPCTQAETDPNDLCPQCGTPTTKYEEVRMANDEYMIVGHPDLLRWITRMQAFHITEIKSMAHDRWKELARAEPAHILQVVFYWFLMVSLGYRVLDKVSILYATKGAIFTSMKPYKEFVIDAPSELHRLTPYLQKAMDVKGARAGGELPLRVVCSGKLATQAIKCEAVKICFGVDE